jgi:large subunit ribosomal protein L6
MSRIGAKPITVPSGAKIRQEGPAVLVEGSKGTLRVEVPALLTVGVKDGSVSVQRANDEKATKALHGLYRALIANMLHGVAVGFQKELEIVGIGYRAQLQGQKLALHVGYSHVVALELPSGISVETPKPTQIVVKGADKQRVGQFAADIRAVRPPEPYKGTGIRYAGEVVRRKAGKAATGAAGKGGGGS